jgi:hypothetical protein
LGTLGTEGRGDWRTFGSLYFGRRLAGQVGDVEGLVALGGGRSALKLAI